MMTTGLGGAPGITLTGMTGAAVGVLVVAATDRPPPHDEDLDHAHVIEEGEVVAAPIAAGEEGDPVPSVRVGLARGRDQGHQASPEVGQGHHKVNQGVGLPQETGS